MSKNELTRWQKFKRFLKRNMTPTWAKHFSYQVFAFIVSVLMVIGVANYAITKSYDERKLTFVENFTITAHTGSFDTAENSIESIHLAMTNLTSASLTETKWNQLHQLILHLHSMKNPRG